MESICTLQHRLIPDRLQVGLNMTSQEWPYRAGLYAIVLAEDGQSPLLPDSE